MLSTASEVSSGCPTSCIIICSNGSARPCIVAERSWRAVMLLLPVALVPHC
jgi:hypothetical protein